MQNTITFLEHIGVPSVRPVPALPAPALMPENDVQTHLKDGLDELRDPIVSRIIQNKIVKCFWSELTNAERRAASNAIFTIYE